MSEPKYGDVFAGGEIPGNRYMYIGPSGDPYFPIVALCLVFDDYAVNPGNPDVWSVGEVCDTLAFTTDKIE